MTGTAEEWNNYNLMNQLERDSEPVAWGTADLTPSNTVVGVEMPEAWQSPWSRRVPRFDDVERPSHYNKGGIEAIDYIKQQLGSDGFIAYCEGNMIKYGHRWRYKNGVQDLKKKRWYLDRMIKELEEEHK
jgi:hypothetical protein